MPALYNLRALLLRRVPDDGADNRTGNRKHGHVGAPGALRSGGRIPAPSQRSVRVRVLVGRRGMLSVCAPPSEPRR